jgi:2-dehydro-3-deoxy-L-rhamnonate dehydrogenase (NAD+)
MNMIDLKGRVAIVTGGAQGIGRAVSQRFAASGARVEIWDIDAKLAQSSAAQIGAGAQGRAVDVTDPKAVTAAVAALEASHGSVDILVTSAGIAGPNLKTWEYPLEEWARIMRLNLDGTLHCCQSVIPGMIKRNYGRLVLIASIAGKEGNPNASAYSASKAAVIALTKSLGKELAGHNNFMLSKIPRGRFVEVDEIAAMIAFLASSENSFTTGAAFDLSGGRATY